MITGWSITLGYNSGHSNRAIFGTTYEGLLAAEATALADNTEALAMEARDFDGVPLSVAMDYAKSFADRTPATISIEDGNVFMMASGDNPARAIKEKMRRAYVRLLMRRMHQHGIDINVEVW